MAENRHAVATLARGRHSNAVPQIMKGRGAWSPWQRNHPEGRQLVTLPRLTLTDLSGKTLNSEQMSGRVVLVEFWATWCPPCRSTLEWLGTLKRQYGDNIAVIALAVESPEDKVQEMVSSFSPELHWAITDARTAVAFGDSTSVPTMFLFERSGRAAKVFYGAPPDLHQQAEKVIDQLIKLGPAGSI